MTGKGSLCLGQLMKVAYKYLMSVSGIAGIGWGMVAISAMVSVYYNVIIMYAIYYMFVSFVYLDGEVPWRDCGNPWNTDLCRNISYPDFDSMTNMTTKVDELVGMVR